MGILYTHVILPLVEPERHAGLPGRLRQIKKFDRLPERQQRKIQQDRLRKLLEHAYNTVPFYRKQFDSVGFHPRQARVDRPLPLPVLTREHLRTMDTWLISTAFPAEKLRVALSSGTDRMPIRFHRDIEGVRDKVALKMKLDEWAGFEAGDSAMMLWGASTDPPGSSIGDGACMKASLCGRPRRHLASSESMCWKNGAGVMRNSVPRFFAVARLSLPYSPRICGSVASPIGRRRSSQPRKC